MTNTLVADSLACKQWGKMHLTQVSCVSDVEDDVYGRVRRVQQNNIAAQHRKRGLPPGYVSSRVVQELRAIQPPVPSLAGGTARWIAQTSGYRGSSVRLGLRIPSAPGGPHNDRAHRPFAPGGPVHRAGRLQSSMPTLKLRLREPTFEVQEPAFGSMLGPNNHHRRASAPSKPFSEDSCPEAACCAHVSVADAASRRQ